MKLPMFIHRFLVKRIKMRVYKEIRSFADYEEATNFIINAPLSEWRIRLWCVTHYRDQFGTGHKPGWQNLLDYITR